MKNKKKAVVVLDACVIYPAPIRDFLLHLAVENLFIPKWSDRIQEEWIRNLLLKRPDLSESALGKTVKAMNEAFPEANIERDRILENKLTLPDKDDRHVLVTAIKAKADYILTFNLKDFPSDYLKKYEVFAISPDDLLCNLYINNPDSVKIAFRNQVKNLKNPPIKALDLLNIFKKVGLPKIANKLSASTE
ncbi:MAG: PIN domain-containing protein [Bacteroidota bacterium]